MPKNFLRKDHLPYLLAALIICFRTLPFVIWGKDILDADEAVYALMAKHLAAGMAFPVFMYGQKYLLAQSSWLAAPFFLLFGPSVALFGSHCWSSISSRACF